MNKFLSRFSTALISLSFAVGVGAILSSEKSPVKTEAAIGDKITIGSNEYESVYETGFENATTSTSYNSTKTYDSTACDGASWSVYYGTVATSSKISGANSMHMRWYASAQTNYPHAETTSPIANVRAIQLKYAVSNVNVDFKVQYSSDGSSWIDIETVNTSSATATTLSYELSEAVSTFYFRVLVCDGTAPSSGNYTFRIDDIIFAKEIDASSVTTSLSVASATWTGYNTQTLNVSDFKVTAATTASDDGYVFQGIGTGKDADFVVRDATFTSGNPLTTDTRLQWKAKYPTTAGGNEYLYAGVDLTVKEDTLSSISVGDKMTKTEYYPSENWDPTGLTVTATYASGATATIDISEVTWTYSPEKPAVGVASVTATASYGGQTATSSAQTVNVTNAILYDLSKISDFSSWNSSYSQHTLTEASFNPAVDTAATIDLLIANKQSSDVGSEYPCLGNKTSTEIEAVKFSLTDSSQVIESVNVTFVTRYTKTYPTLILHKGVGIESTALTEISTSGEAGNEQVLSYSGINDSAFTIGYNANQTSSNGAVGIKSIVVALKEASFGVLDHIKVASMPNKTLYGVGEKFDITGLIVTAYDGADELTANSKDVTATASHMLEDGYTFAESDVTDAFVAYVGYTENGVTVSTSYSILVANNSSYSLVTTEQSDWTGEYLVVTNNAGSLLGLNASLDVVDISSNFVNLTATDNTISTPSFNSIVIEKMEGGYSVKSTYTGKYYGNNIDDNGLSSDISPILNTISLNSDGTASIVSNTRTLAFNKNSDQQRFRYFLTPSAQQSVYLYRKATLTKDDFAEMFLKQLTCDPTGVNAPDVEEWDILNLYFDDLSESDKLVFKVSQGNTSGTSVEQAIAKYDYILTKYGVSKYVDFMGRVEYGSLTLANNRIEFADKLDSQSTIICVVVLTLLSVSTIGGYIILKRTKEN